MLFEIGNDGGQEGMAPSSVLEERAAGVKLLMVH